MAQTLGETKDDPVTLAARMAQLTAAHNIERDALLQSQADEAAKAQAQIKDAYAKLAVRQVQQVTPGAAPGAQGDGGSGNAANADAGGGSGNGAGGGVGTASGAAAAGEAGNAGNTGTDGTGTGTGATY